MKKYISIITINLNNKEGLEKSINSLIAQNQKDKIEYIVVDGNSTDGSIEVIEKYKKNIDKIVVEKDNGIFDAMNKGIDLAEGEYIYFLNSGDIFASNDVLNEVMKVIKDLKEKPNIIAGKVAVYRFGEYISVADLYPWIVHQSAFVKTLLIKEYMFDERFKIFGDLDLWTRLQKDGKYTIYKINKIIAKMELEGIGSHPKFTFRRLEDKWYYAKKHKKYLNYFLSFIIGIISYTIYAKKGEKFYYFKYMPFIQKIKKAIKKPFWAIRMGGIKLYSILTFPVYKVLLKRYGFGSFIHPFSSIGNHNLLSIGRNVTINHNVTIWGDNVFIGDFTQINPGVCIYGNVQIGAYVMIGPNCMIAGANHSYETLDIPMRFQGGNSKGILIEEDVWIGANCVILDGITIGKGSVIGAGSIVTKNIPPYSIVIGNPAKIIKSRKNDNN